MSVPFLTIADALAARYAAAAVTPPTGLRNIALSTARVPNNLVNVPIVVVFPPEPGKGEATYQAGRRISVIPFTVRFHFDKASGDLAKVSKALYEWATVLYDQTHGATKLGVAGVMKALPTSLPGMATLTLAGTEYDGIEWTVTVWYEDNITLVAA